MIEKVLYHGSPYKVRGNMLLPRKGNDILDSIDNVVKAVYATEEREIAIAFGILKLQGIKGSGLYSRKIDNSQRVWEAIIYLGWPNQEHFYLYTLPSDSFENRPINSHQWLSISSVKPNRIEKLAIQDYMHLIRIASPKEQEAWKNRQIEARRKLTKSSISQFAIPVL